MPHRPSLLIALALPVALAVLLLPARVGAQLGLGEPLRGGMGSVGGIGGVVGGVAEIAPLDRLDRLSPVRAARDLLAARVQRLRDFVRQNREAVAFDDHGDPAARGVVLVTGASGAALDALRQAGYRVEQDDIEGLDLGFARIMLPPEGDLANAIKRMRTLAPGAGISADTLHFASGSAPAASERIAGQKLAGKGAIGEGAAGLIDGGVAAHAVLGGAIEQRGFAKGAPAPSAHGTAVASLVAGDGAIGGAIRGAIRGAAPGAPLLVADVYGRDPAGGGALAIARALGWLASRHASVVTISLVGPQNPLLASAIRQVRARGMAVVAAVGNDGPAAPPAYPASYPGVIAVTGVDGRDRALIEAGRAAHLDYAAPGADMGAARMAGGAFRVRGTSFAAPLVAGTLYRLHRGQSLQRAMAMLDADARDLGPKGADPVYGRGLLCASCRNTY